MPKKIDPGNVIRYIVSIIPIIIVALGLKMTYSLIKKLCSSRDQYASEVEVKEAEVEIRENRIPGEDENG